MILTMNDTLRLLNKSPGQKASWSLDVSAVAAVISRIQRSSGEILWSEELKTDPWDHVATVMGLSIGSQLHKSRRAFDWLVRHQQPDGCWYAAYLRGRPIDKTRDANMSAYVAVGILHYFLITRDTRFLLQMWPSLRAAIDFALRLQAPGGEIYWAISPQGKTDPMALLTGSSSIYMSIKCALVVAKHLGFQMPEWRSALVRLKNAVVNKPHHFNMTKSRFAMDWFYPVLAGALSGQAARDRLKKSWKKFVIDGQGVRCVSDQDWVTLAETAELCLTLAAVGNRTLAEIVFNWIVDKRFEDGSYWCGYTYPDMVIWPEEKIAWTNAVVLMAADAIFNLTPAGQLFSHDFWSAMALA